MTYQTPEERDELLRALIDEITADKVNDDESATKKVAGCLLKTLFAQYEEEQNGTKSPRAKTWADYWKACWPSDRKWVNSKNKDIRFQPKVVQALRRLKYRLDAYYSTKGSSLPYRADLRSRPYGLIFRKNERPQFLMPAGPLRKANVVGLLCSYRFEWFNQSLISGAEFAAREEGKRLIVAFGMNGDLGIETLQLESVTKQCAGLIVVPSPDVLLSGTGKLTEPYRKLLHNRYPFVFVDRQVPNCPAPVIGWDNKEGGRMAAAYLIRERQCTEVFVVSEFNSPVAQDRIEGFTEYLREVNGKRYSSKVEFSNGYSFAKQLFTSASGRITFPRSMIGIFATDDETAQKVQLFVDRHSRDNRRGRIAIIGFGGTSYLRPPGSDRLATVDQDYHGLGQRAVRILVKLIRLGQANKLARDLQKYSEKFPLGYLLPLPGTSGTISTNTLLVDEEEYTSQSDSLIGKPA